jgi:hypothetical protein
MKTIILLLLLSLTYNTKAIISKAAMATQQINTTDATLKTMPLVNEETVLYFPSFLATLGFAFAVIGLLTILFGGAWQLPVLLGFIAMVFGALGFGEIKRKKIRGKTLATAGLIGALLSIFVPFVIKKN